MVADAPTIPLFCREYGSKAGDWQEISGWWDARDSFFAETILPPLGIVVERDGERLAALWCYESYGIGVAFLEFPCTRPGIPPALAWRALLTAENAIAKILRRRGEHKVIRAFAKPAHAKALQRIGYDATGENYTSVIRRIA